MNALRTTHTLKISEAFDLAVKHYEARQLDEAENLCRQLVEMLPNHDAGRFLLARIYSEMSAFQESYDILLPALARSPGNGQMRALAAKSLLLLGRIDEAAALAGEALALNPELRDAHRTQAHLALIRGEFADATASARRAVALNPTSALNRADLATILMAAGAFAAAIGEFSVWAEETPESDVPHYVLGMLITRAEFAGHMTPDATRAWFNQRVKGTARPTARALYELFLSAFEFRHGNRSKANHLCAGATKAMRDLNPAFVNAEWSAAQAQQVKKLVAGREEVWPESPGSLYQDDKTLARLYAEYVYALLRDQPHGHGTTLTGWHLLEQTRRLLGENGGIDAVANFGCFAGAIDQKLAREFPQVRFFGVDRGPFIKSRNEAQFAAPNLEYFAADFLDWLRDSAPVGDGLLLHSRTAIYVMPAMLEKIYRLAREKGYRHVLLAENFGIDRATATWPAFGTGFASYLLRNRILVHDYPQLLRRSGFAPGAMRLIPMVNAQVVLRAENPASDLSAAAWRMPDFHLLCLHATTEGAA